MKIEFYSFWGGFSNQSDYPGHVKYYEELFKDSEYDIIQVYSVFGAAPQSLNTDPKILTIQITGEACYKDPSKYNLSLIPKVSSNQVPASQVITSYFAAYDMHIQNNIHKLTEKRTLGLKTKFCNFIVSNGGPGLRKDFFLELSKHKFVDSCGRFLKNWTGPPAPPFSTDEYHTFLNDWRFMICFENQSQDYYLTEKFMNAYLGGCIPIYWGCPQVSSLFNKKAFLLLEDTGTDSINKLINQIMELENNPELYAQMHSEPLFVNNEIAKEFTMQYIKDQLQGNNQLQC